MAKKYPLISNKEDRRKKWNHTVKCELCGEQAEYRLTIETNYFRGDDVTVKSCEDCTKEVETLAMIGIAKEVSKSPQAVTPSADTV
jgi:hypothetical protein